LFGFVAIAVAIEWTSLFIRDVSEHPYGVQAMFAALGAILIGTFTWICLGFSEVREMLAPLRSPFAG
jgi:hypothetical protein